MITVCVAGITGWTGRPIAAAINATDDLHLISAVSRSAAGATLAEVIGADGNEGEVYASVTEALAATHPDVLVDYTSASVVRDNVVAAVDAGVHVVVGSSGLAAEDYAELDGVARSRAVGVVAAGNFSLTAAVMLRAARLAAEHLDHWEIIDYASETKPDVPSGTAREIVELLAEIRRPAIGVPLTRIVGPVEARGAEVAGTRVHSVRLPGFVVATDVVFGSGGQRLVLHHDPGGSPDAYIAGTLLAVRRVADVIGVRRGLDTLLFDGA